MKKCTKCKWMRPESEYCKYYRNKDGLRSQCKVCDKEYDQANKEHRNKRKNRNKKLKRKELYTKLMDYIKDKPCPCGESDFVVMEFDHRDMSSKEFNISEAMTKCYSWEKILRELEKCDPLCANCHRRKTAKDMGWYQF